MLISHKHRYLFIEIPNTACTSMKRLLTEHYEAEPVLHKHATYTEFRRIASPEERQYFVFAGIRNPLDSCVTQYMKLKNNHHGRFTDQKRLGTWSLTRRIQAKYNFVQRENADFPMYFRAYVNRVYNNFYLTGHEKFDYVIRFESLQEDLGEVRRRIGMPTTAELPHVNPTSGKRHFLEYYTPDLYQPAMRVFGPFMLKWGYQFPSEWGPVRIPWSSQVRFRTMDSFAKLAARKFGLAPNSHGRVMEILRNTVRAVWA